MVLDPECFDAGMLGRRFVSSVAVARQHLLEPDAVVLPRRVRSFAALARIRTALGEPDSSGVAIKVDVEPLVRRFGWSPGLVHASVKGHRKGKGSNGLSDDLNDAASAPRAAIAGLEWEAMSEPFEAVALDLNSPEQCERAVANTQASRGAQGVEVKLLAQGGVINAVVSWMELDFGNGHVVSTAPHAQNHAPWTQCVQWISPPVVDARAGGKHTATVDVTFSDSQLVFSIANTFPVQADLDPPVAVVTTGGDPPEDATRVHRQKLKIWQSGIGNIPLSHWYMWSDRALMGLYQRAIVSSVREMSKVRGPNPAQGGVQVIDAHAGVNYGAWCIIASKAGAGSVTGLHPPPSEDSNAVGLSSSSDTSGKAKSRPGMPSEKLMMSPDAPRISKRSAVMCVARGLAFHNDVPIYMASVTETGEDKVYVAQKTISTDSTKSAPVYSLDATGKVRFLEEHLRNLKLGDGVHGVFRRQDILILSVPPDGDIFTESWFTSLQEAKACSLMATDARVIPGVIDVYAMVIAYDDTYHRHHGDDDDLSSTNKPKTNRSGVINCAATRGFLDAPPKHKSTRINLDNVKHRTLTAPCVVASWDLERRLHSGKGFTSDALSVRNVPVACSTAGAAEAVVYWWELRSSTRGNGGDDEELRVSSGPGSGSFSQQFLSPLPRTKVDPKRTPRLHLNMTVDPTLNGVTFSMGVGEAPNSNSGEGRSSSGASTLDKRWCHLWEEIIKRYNVFHQGVTAEPRIFHQACRAAEALSQGPNTFYPMGAEGYVDVEEVTELASTFYRVNEY